MVAVDYAFEKPTVAQLVAAGVTDVFRYTGPVAWGKTITQAEYDALLVAGIRVWLVFESGSNDSAGGFNAGVANAHTAIQCAPAGYTGPIFFACDEDLTGPALATAVEYIRGASTAIGVARTGDYGPGALCLATHDAGYATFHWQSASTSFNNNAHTLPITHVQQGGPGPLPGTDLDTILLPLTPPAPVPDPVSDPELELVMSLASNPTDALNFLIRDKWATYRTDTLTVQDVQYLTAVFNQKGLDATLACLIDTARTTGHLRSMFSGAA